MCVDKSVEQLGIAAAAMAAAHPAAVFEHLDVLASGGGERLAGVVAAAASSAPATACFIDINGTRARDAVLECLAVVREHLRPQLVVVKSEALFAELPAA